MKKIINLSAVVIVCIIASCYTANASSHREAPLISNDPLADNTDLYVFRSPCDTNNVVIIANYIPFEHPAGGPNYYNFGTDVRYEIHIDNNTATPGDDIVYRFVFSQTNEDPTTFFNIRLGKQNLKDTYKCLKSTDGGKTFFTIISSGVVPPNNIGPRSIENSTVGLGAASYDDLMMQAITTASTGEKVFCGPIDDPFFVDLGGAFDVGNFRPVGRDGLAKFNCHTICIEVPISSLQKDGKKVKKATSILDPDFVIGVYASASRQKITTLYSSDSTNTSKWIQVSRLGMPLTNEVVIPIGEKDMWNTAKASGDAQFGPYFNNPELALYMDDSQFGGAVPGLSQLRIQTNSLGAYDFRNGKEGLYPLKGTSAVAGTALDDAIFGNLLLPDDHSPRAVDLLPAFLTGVPNLAPYQLATGKPAGNPLAAGKPFVNNFLPTLEDRLRLNMAVPVTPRNSADFSSLGLIQAAALGLTDARFNTTTNLQFIPNMDGFPNGRRLEDDVTTIELQAVSGVVLAAIGLWYDDYTIGGNPLTPDFLNVYTFNAGVTKNDTTFKSCFPYVQAPWRGFVGRSYKGEGSNAPGISWIDFTANGTPDKQVMLQWNVTPQSTDDHYEVEYSTNASAYTKLTNISAGAGLNGSYTYRHASPSLNTVNYYRIKKVKTNGSSIYLPVRYVKFAENNSITITPNPASNQIIISSAKPLSKIEIYDASGHKMLTHSAIKTNVQINIASFISGNYTVVGYDENGQQIDTKKFIKQ